MILVNLTTSDCAGPLHLQVVSFVSPVTANFGSPTDISKSKIVIAIPITATWRIHGMIGKNTVEYVELTALQQKQGYLPILYNM